MRTIAYQVVTEELHDESRVLVALLGQGVELCISVSFVQTWLLRPSRTSNGVIESLLSELASLVGRVENLVVENGEVQRETETDGVGRGKVGSSNIGSSLVGLERLVGRGLALVTNGKLGEVTVVVALPEEDMMVSKPG
jgi:hypothetical protein